MVGYIVMIDNIDAGKFPLVLLQAKVVGSKNTKTKAEALVSISSPSSEGGGSSVLEPRHSKTFRPPNRRTPLIKKSTREFLPK
mgnify:CR=1 FL=1